MKKATRSAVDERKSAIRNKTTKPKVSTELVAAVGSVVFRQNTCNKQTNKNATMTTKLDLNLGLKLIKPYDGNSKDLANYIESVELFREYSEGVDEHHFLKFLRTTLTGVAHGVITPANTIEEALKLLKEKFAVKMTPLAVEHEMGTKRQGKRDISEYGSEIEALSAKLAAAHVSAGNFVSEGSAKNIVETTAIRAFIGGLSNPTTKFFLKARNPPTLSKAISDALECSSEFENNDGNHDALWNHRQNWYNRPPMRARGGYRRPSGFRYLRGNQRGNNNAFRGSSSFLPNRSNPNNTHQHENFSANDAPTQEEEDVNLLDLFR
ncbi:uncharacterized protein LOC120898113 [Anopheles arabiensis]|uniref:uncharacterized protein LOC120898113 n=1 Tax=Anopheles arabiensis TaxID=7173 RepID=UPI001AAE1409|nr:uncharacterized protein LOC120898113 [Anopheles arabiensis]